MTKPRPPATNPSEPPVGESASTPADGDSLIDRFVQFRRANGLTQETAAARMEMSVNSLRAYERKSRTPNGPATLKILTLMGALK